ncbi:MAG TPA: 6-carboxytetrahydropterin synthase [Ktedonobacteraceae bacterium]|jgi:6-pyruvoyltetrahydropterin/6-carboxytetrahydropterin synthase|nr:6-carboxytetrahydropterin synthase [Ktedonobacteraceae bacterium]
MVYLTRRATFSAAHRLWSEHLTEAENYAVYDKCANPNGHGHNYILEVTVRGQPDERTGMLLNLTELKGAIENAVIKWVDHKHLNRDVPWLEGIIPTTEMLVMAFWRRLETALPARMLYEVKLHETENNIAVYRGEEQA